MIRRAPKSWFLFCLALAICPAATQACSVCFGDPDSDLSKGLNAGVLALLVVVSTVLSGFAAFFVFVARRSSLTPLPKTSGSDQPAGSSD
jgi:hypothetical protein